MANTDNECKNLEIEDFHADALENGDDTLADIFNIQADSQKNVYKWDFENMTLQQIKDYWYLNNHSYTDEVHEAMDALGGIKDGIGSAVWKTWKKDYPKGAQMKISDLSEGDKLELKFEVIDQLHFFLNTAISIGMTPKEMYNMFISKNKENKSRQTRDGGY